MPSRRRLPQSLSAKLIRVRMVVMDVDGVLTDGRLIYDESGRELKVFDVRDGYGITRARKLGLTFAIISGRRSAATLARARELGISDVHQGRDEKLGVLNRLIKKRKLKHDEVCFIGDDVLDLSVIERVGMSASPRDAVEDVREKVDYVTRNSAGRGAVREVVDLILRAKGLI